MSPNLAAARVAAVPETPGMPADLLAHARAAKGFMPEDEGLLLHRVARERLPHGPVLEVGTYCGKSAIYLGAAAREVGRHRRSPSTTTAARRRTRPAGSTTTPSLVDPEFGLMDTLPVFRRTLARAGLEDQVVAVVGRSHHGLARCWRTPAVAALHRRRARRGARPERLHRLGALADGRRLLVIHDVFPDPADGGRPPYHVFLRALASGAFERGRGAGLDAGATAYARGRRRPGRLTGSRTRGPARRSAAPGVVAAHDVRARRARPPSASTARITAAAV